ncbi:FkbM family methyltransferase [Zavarzinella formosa]|uniref:FkbM family methyltransferase n=1 Tax=Zavarzinella formosa TaxID=360055 RepID=UPI0002FB3F57|nr:FkbM family methyltransferase [Zavarzinella formosa]
MSDLILSALFIHHPLPTGFGSANKVGAHWRTPLSELTIDQLADYVEPLRVSARRLGLRVVILHDGVPEELARRLETDLFRLVHVRNRPETNPYDARFFAFGDWLRANPVEGIVTITDVNDSVVALDPGEWYRSRSVGGAVVCGRDGGPVAANSWWTSNIDWMPLDYVNLFRKTLADTTAVTCGTLIGPGQRVGGLIDRLCAEIDRVLDGWGGPGQPPRGADIHAFNVLAHAGELGPLDAVPLTPGNCPVWHDRGALTLLVPVDIKHRPGTLDRDIWASVHDHNEYGLPEQLRGATVVDVGCHIGSFSSLCKSRGAAEIWGADSSIDNVRLAMRNMAATPGRALFQAFHAAVWRSDRRGERLDFGGHDGVNTGGAWAIPHDDRRESEVPTMPFDDLLKLASDYGRRRVSVVKLDCEGSEWPILFTSRMLGLVDLIVGEYHLEPLKSFGPERQVAGVAYSLGSLRDLLEKEGFEVEIRKPNSQQFNLFFARRIRP